MHIAKASCEGQAANQVVAKAEGAHFGLGMVGALYSGTSPLEE